MRQSNSFCCCNLQTEAIGLGWLSLVIDILSLCGAIYSRSQIEECSKKEYGTDNSHFLYITWGLTVLQYRLDQTSSNKASLHHALVVVQDLLMAVVTSISSFLYWLSIVGLVIGIIVDWALLWGAYKEKPSMLLPWLTISAFKIFPLINEVVGKYIFAGMTDFILIFDIGGTVFSWLMVLILYLKFRA